MLRVLFEQKSIELGSIKLEVIRRTPLTEAGRDLHREEGEAKQGNDLMGCSLSGRLIWESLVGCL